MLLVISVMKKINFKKGGIRILGEIVCSLRSTVSGVLLKESFQQRLEGGEECAVRLSGGTVLRKEGQSKKKTPRKVYALLAQGQTRGPMCLKHGERKSNRR